MQFLSIFRKTWWLRMSKTLKKEKIRCPGGFLEEIKAICVEKMHQTQTEIDKNTKKNLKNFMQFLCTFRKTWWLRIRMLKTFSKENSLSWLLL